MNFQRRPSPKSNSSPSELAIQERELALKEADLVIKQRELAIKEAALAIRRSELSLQESTHKLSRWGSPLVIAILAASLAAGANVWVGKINGENAHSLEQKKWAQAQEAEHKKRVDALVGEYARLLSRGHQQASWVIWKRLNDPDHFKQEDKDAYDSGMREILPALTSTSVQLATHDEDLRKRLSPLAKKLSNLDAKIAEILINYTKSNVKYSNLKTLQKEVAKSATSLGENISLIKVKSGTLPDNFSEINVSENARPNDIYSRRSHAPAQVKPQFDETRIFTNSGNIVSRSNSSSGSIRIAGDLEGSKPPTEKTSSDTINYNVRASPRPTPVTIESNTVNIKTNK